MAMATGSATGLATGLATGSATGSAADLFPDWCSGSGSASDGAEGSASVPDPVALMAAYAD